MTKAVIQMPYKIALNSEYSRRQFYSHAQVLLTERDQLKAENELMRHQLSACAKELRAASDWICREVEGGTRSATHWAVRMKTNADQIDAAMGKGEQA